jgi:hypothetical protein
METKICTSCKQEKPLAAFHRFGADGSKLGKWCEACYQAKAAGQQAKPSPKQPLG